MKLKTNYQIPNHNSVYAKLDLRKRTSAPDSSPVFRINFSVINLSADKLLSDKIDSEILSDDPIGNAFLRKSSKSRF